MVKCYFLTKTLIGLFLHRFKNGANCMPYLCYMHTILFIYYMNWYIYNKYVKYMNIYRPYIRNAIV